MKNLATSQLYTFIDTAYLHGRAPEAVAQDLCDGGADIIQLRAKNANRDDIRSMTESILPVTSPAGVPLLINDHPDLVGETGAQGCHVGQEDFFDQGHTQTAAIRPTDRPGIIGLSTHSPEQAARSLQADPDYIAIGPVYATGTKPTARPVTLDYVRWASREVSLPWFAIGGINLETLDEVLEAGARRICVVSAILNAPDLAEACQQFRKRLTSAAFE